MVVLTDLHSDMGFLDQFKAGLFDADDGGYPCHLEIRRSAEVRPTAPMLRPLNY